jgi:hypothetical protein
VFHQRGGAGDRLSQGKSRGGGDVDGSIVAVRAGEANVALTDPCCEWPLLHPYDGLGNVGRSSGREAAHAAGDDGNAEDRTAMVWESRPATPDRCSDPRRGAEDQLTQGRDGGPADARSGPRLLVGRGHALASSGGS